MLLDREINRILKEEIGKLVSEMKSNLDKAGKGNSNLKNSIKYKVDAKGSAEVSMNEYGQYIDKGVSGKNDPNFKGKKKTVHKSKAGLKFGSGKFRGQGDAWEKKIDKWMSKKGIGGNAGISKGSINFLIRRSIYQHGVKGTLFASNSFKGFREKLHNRLSTIDFNKIINTK